MKERVVPADQATRLIFSDEFYIQEIIAFGGEAESSQE